MATLKHKYLLKTIIIVLICLVSYNANSQNLITVGILPDLDTDFSSIQAAIDAASPGDIIQITPGVYLETGITIDKQVYIQGAGFLVEFNYSTLGFLSGSTVLNSTVSISGSGSSSIIEGVDIVTLNVTDAVDVLIRRSRIRRGHFINSNVNILGSLLNGSMYNSENAQYLLSNTINITFSNCLFFDVSGTDRLYHISPRSGQTPSGNLTFDRCIFRNRLHNSLPNVVVEVANSIFLTNTGAITTRNASGSIVVNSLFELSSSQDASTANNIFGISGAAEFNGYPSGTPSFDAQYMLSDTSQAMGYANDGGDCGIFGGVNPYVLSGIPSIPFIYNFDANQQGSTGGGLDVNIRVRSQN